MDLERSMSEIDERRLAKAIVREQRRMKWRGRFGCLIVLIGLPALAYFGFRIWSGIQWDGERPESPPSGLDSTSGRCVSRGSTGSPLAPTWPTEGTRTGTRGPRIGLARRSSCDIPGHAWSPAERGVWAQEAGELDNTAGTERKGGARARARIEGFG